MFGCVLKAVASRWMVPLLGLCSFLRQLNIDRRLTPDASDKSSNEDMPTLFIMSSRLTVDLVGSL